MYTSSDEINLQAISIDPWPSPVFESRNLQASVLRLDRIHPEISGNKWFKLKYWLERAISEKKTALLSFGGPYSNHILATAALADMQRLSSIGIIRGEAPPNLSPTLLQAKGAGMELVFISRRDYDQKNNSESIAGYQRQYPHALIIPEGGAGEPGIRGSREIFSFIPDNHFTHIACAVGTGTMFTGLSLAARVHQKVLGVAVLKGPGGLPGTIFHEYHFGGYAKKTAGLIGFMNELYGSSRIPTDFVYTAKLFYGIHDLAGNGFFDGGSRLLVIHSGGLQGNRSLPSGTLHF